MAHYRATLAYDGSAYDGYQIQVNRPTIQAEVESALAKIFGERIPVVAAGRTDSGVHATGQVIAFDAEWKHNEATLLRAVNANLPEDIALQNIQQQQAAFHPRFDALSRTYRYHVAVVDVRQPLLMKRAWQLQQQLGIAQMQRAAKMLVGQHDFASFGNPPQGENTVRELFRSAWQTENFDGGQWFIYEVEASAYLHHMVRRLVGTQVAIGSGQLTLEMFEAIFRSADLSQCKWIAPPQGLTLVEVSYPPAGLSRDAYLQAQEQKVTDSYNPSEVR
jgi:tRNA pseudouridine38-40 synthase